MKKSVGLFSIFTILLLVSSVIAVGSSTGARIDSADEDKIENNFIVHDAKVKDRMNSRGLAEKRDNIAKRLTSDQKKEVREACEETENRRERIKCRLQYIKDNKEEFRSPYDKAPEACRNLEDDKKRACVAFYKKSRACYDKEGTEKNMCFKRISNFVRSKLSEEKEDRGQKARDYAVLLLYDIQERIEKGIENDKIDPDAGAEAIDKIVEIKEQILNGATKREVAPNMLLLRTLLKDLKPTLDEEGEENEETE